MFLFLLCHCDIRIDYFYSHALRLFHDIQQLQDQTLGAQVNSPSLLRPVLTMSTQTPTQSNPTLTPGSQSTLGSMDPAVAEKKIMHTETAALEAVSSDSDVESFQEKGENIVHWDGDDDPQDPMNWSPARKWMTIGLISVSSFNVYVSTIHHRLKTPLTHHVTGLWFRQFSPPAYLRLRKSSIWITRLSRRLWFPST